MPRNTRWSTKQVSKRSKPVEVNTSPEKKFRKIQSISFADGMHFEVGKDKVTSIEYDGCDLYVKRDTVSNDIEPTLSIGVEGEEDIPADVVATDMDLMVD